MQKNTHIRLIVRPNNFWYRINLICFLVCLAILALPLCVSAEVTKAVIYPKGAILTEQARLSTGENLFFIPAQARPETLTARLGDNQFRIAALTREMVTTAPSKVIAALEAALEEKNREKTRIEDKIKTISGKIGFWENQIAREWETAEDAIKIAASLEAPLDEGYKSKTDLQADLTDVEKAIQEIREKLANLRGSQHRQWEIRMTLAGPDKMQCPVTYSYFFSEAGFNPFYRLNADMKKDAIAFSWNADIWQRTGKDWQNATVILTTARPAFELAPPDLPPWIVREQKPVFARKNLMADSAHFAGKAQAERTALPEPSEEIIQKTTRQTTTEWHLGKRGIPAGDPQRIHIEDTTLPATFVHLLRPSETEKSFVRASIDLDTPLQAPRGRAIFMIDNTMVGQTVFSLQAQEADLFFGTDPLVTAKRKLIEKKAGKEGFIRNEQTHQLVWETALENAHAYPVNVRVETPAPQARDKAIQVSRKLTPPPSEISSTHDTLIWERTIPGGSTDQIREDITITAPSSMNLDIGL
ncbi:MAG: mucoidy inhibitor MuiA family protein [Thermodesulfobacteriota bacterium]|nr:mucoidy inhibitor MuiA family protein [Thermodesulfobacteriota bacterium]